MSTPGFHRNKVAASPHRHSSQFYCKRRKPPEFSSATIKHLYQCTDGQHTKRLPRQTPSIRLNEVSAALKCEQQWWSQWMVTGSTSASWFGRHAAVQQSLPAAQHLAAWLLHSALIQCWLHCQPFSTGGILPSGEHVAAAAPSPPARTLARRPEHLARRHESLKSLTGRLHRSTGNTQFQKKITLQEERCSTAAWPGVAPLSSLLECGRRRRRQQNNVSR